jgi:hypothetical protein
VRKETSLAPARWDGNRAKAGARMHLATERCSYLLGAEGVRPGRSPVAPRTSLSTCVNVEGNELFPWMRKINGRRPSSLKPNGTHVIVLKAAVNARALRLGCLEGMSKRFIERLSPRTSRWRWLGISCPAKYEASQAKPQSPAGHPGKYLKQAIRGSRDLVKRGPWGCQSAPLFCNVKGTFTNSDATLKAVYTVSTQGLLSAEINYNATFEAPCRQTRFYEAQRIHHIFSFRGSSFNHTMMTAPVLFLVLSFLYHSSTVTPMLVAWVDLFFPGDNLSCADYGTDTRFSRGDCLKAIEMIPAGLKPPIGPYIAQHGNSPLDPTRPISLEWDKRKYFLPAAFRSGDCVVRVSVDCRSIDRPCQPSFTADFLYRYLWPRVKEVAPKAMDHCLAPLRRTRTVNYIYNFTYGTVLNERLNVQLRVTISALKNGSDVNGEKALRKATYINQLPRCNVYDADNPADWNPGSGAHRSVPRSVVERREQRSSCQRPRFHR